MPDDGNPPDPGQRDGSPHPPPPGGPPPPPAGGVPGPHDRTAGWRPVHPRADASAAAIGGRLLAIRPMSVGDILDGAFHGLHATFVPAALVVVVLIGPLQLLLNLALTRLVPAVTVTGFEAFDMDDPAVVPLGEVVAFLGVSAIGGILAFLITLIVSAAVVALVLQVDRGEDPDVASAVRTAGRVLGTTLGASLLLVLGAIAATVAAFVLLAVVVELQPVVGFLLLFLVMLPAGVILGGAFFGFVNVIIPIAVVERRGVMATIARAFWIVRVRFWRLVGISLLVFLLFIAVFIAVQVPFSILAGLAGGFGWVVTSVGEVLYQVVTIPITVLAVLLVYLDTRVRFEGLDLQLRSRGLGRS